MLSLLFAFIATKLFWTLSWRKTVSNYRTLGTIPCLRGLALYFGVPGSYAGRLHTNDDSHWLRRSERANENREAHVPRPRPRLGPGRLSKTSKILVQQDINLLNQAICWFGA